MLSTPPARTRPSVDDHLLCGRSDGHEAGSTLPVERHPRDRHGKARAQRRRAANRRLDTLLERCAHDDVVDLGGIDLRALNSCAIG
jgi:hypothetical protein